MSDTINVFRDFLMIFPRNHEAARIFQTPECVAGWVLTRTALSVREADVIQERYGSETNRLVTLKQIAVGQGVSQERVRQIESKAIRKLKNPKTLSLIAAATHNEEQPRRRSDD